MSDLLRRSLQMFVLEVDINLVMGDLVCRSLPVHARIGKHSNETGNVWFLSPHLDLESLLSIKLNDI